MLYNDYNELEDNYTYSIIFGIPIIYAIITMPYYMLRTRLRKLRLNRI